MVAKPRETSVKLAVDLGGLAMKNPVTVASGTFAAGREYADFVDVALPNKWKVFVQANRVIMAYANGTVMLIR